MCLVKPYFKAVGKESHLSIAMLNCVIVINGCMTSQAVDLFSYQSTFLQSSNQNPTLVAGLILVSEHHVIHVR